VREYLERRQVPVHPLYARHYTSIGCGPCTRATEPGESERAGRWWWEGETDKECGLHFTPSGKVLRTVDVLLEQVLQPHA
jgi:phosphoadenosine phosphosulfate reductase